jgi:hypothetical protein
MRQIRTQDNEELRDSYQSARNCEENEIKDVKVA